ncbi:tRNA (adenine-N1)-methyltransferase [Desulfoplanes sp.]
MLQAGQLVMLVSPKGKRYFRVLDPEGVLHTHDGKLALGDVLELGFGAHVETHLGRPYSILLPTLYDLIKGIKRHTQIMYPKDIGYALLRLGVGPGKRIIEAGSGSGGMTTALAWSVGREGKVFSYDRREEFSELCRNNLQWAGLAERVEWCSRDIAEGFEQTGADGLFLDVRTPWEYLEQAAAAMGPGAPIGFLLPTTNQVQDLLMALEKAPFGDVEVLEVLLRKYKVNGERFRPDDRMVAHTGFLIFARKKGG